MASQDIPTASERDFLEPEPSLAPGSVHAGFEVVSATPVPEVSGTIYVLRHQASGARAMWIACADTNKSFSIAFKTPPADDTGVFHIIEHSVLCGSEAYPVKEPFVNLLKTSMQTFLNALTFPDKTMYPVASTNTADLENLMGVYLDAVLHPAIYHLRAGGLAPRGGRRRLALIQRGGLQRDEGRPLRPRRGPRPGPLPRPLPPEPLPLRVRRCPACHPHPHLRGLPRRACPPLRASQQLHHPLRRHGHRP